MADESEISKFYAFKKILITGGSGFMGKVLIWKLLYSCPELDTIYAMIRSKYGEGVKSRREKFFQSPIFDHFKKVDPKILGKVVFIPGDVGEEGMGLIEEDRNMLIDQVSVIFHGAANLKMNADLYTAVNVNTVGTIRMLEMAKQMKKLQAFVHISTAFCCCENSTIEEKLYPSKHNPYDIINLTKWMESEHLENITPRLIYPSPNTYIYTKRLTETLLRNYESEVPIIVARPSMVQPCYKEPIPGWTDSMNGPAGFFLAGAKGVIRTTRLNLNSKTDIIPVDLAINSIVILPWAHSQDKFTIEERIYSSKLNPYNIIKLTKWMDPEMQESITRKLIYPSPNTYVYTKRLTEALMLDYQSKVPIIVVRPSIVTFSLKEPFPGWTDSLNGPVGLFVAGAKGVLRTLRLNMNAKTDIIPVDLVINSCLILPWANSREQLLKQLSVYNITQNSVEDLTWRKMLHSLLLSLDKYPLELILWYRAGDEIANNNIIVCTFKTIFQHYLPAYLIDFIMLICGKKPFLVKVHNKLRLGEEVLIYFTMKRWSFAHDKILKLEGHMNATDKQLFPVDMARIESFQNYMDSAMLSAKKYLFKEDMNRIDKAKRTMNIMYVVDRLALVLRYYILWKILTFMFGLLMDIFY